MTTTAHEDQFTDAPEPVRQQYSTADILRRNVADLELALKQQAERAKKAEAELAKARKQKPVFWYAVDEITNDFMVERTPDADIEWRPLFAAPVPAPAVPEEWRDALATGAKWMRFWLSQHDCECETIHTCGYQQRRSELRKMEALLQSAEVTK